jgi:hypothetical protein
MDVFILAILAGPCMLLDAANGQEIWKVQIDGVVTDSPLVTDDTITLAPKRAPYMPWI